MYLILQFVYNWGLGLEVHTSEQTSYMILVAKWLRGTAPPIFGPCLLYQTARWIKISLGSEVHLSSDDLLLYRDPARQLPPKEHCHPNFWHLLWTNGWKDQDATWYGGRPRPRPRSVRWGPSSPPERDTAPPSFRRMPIVAKRSPISATAEHLLHNSRQSVVGPWHLLSYKKSSAWLDLDPYLIPGSLSPPEPATQTASRSVQPFLHPSRQRVLIRYCGHYFSAKLPVLVGQILILIYCMISWAYPSPPPQRHLDRFSRCCTVHCSVSQYFTMGRHFPENCPLPWVMWTTT